MTTVIALAACVVLALLAHSGIPALVLLCCAWACLSALGALILAGIGMAQGRYLYAAWFSLCFVLWVDLAHRWWHRTRRLLGR